MWDQVWRLHHPHDEGSCTCSLSQRKWHIIYQNRQESKHRDVFQCLLHHRPCTPCSAEGPSENPTFGTPLGSVALALAALQIAQ